MARISLALALAYAVSSAAAAAAQNKGGNQQNKAPSQDDELWSFIKEKVGF